jgi:hypothetical protein
MLQRLLLAPLIGLCLLLAGQTAPAHAQDPVLTLVFSGNTDGNFAPCPS